MKAAQLPNVVHKPRQFDLSGLKGISDKTLEMHFKLYEGYVKETNRLTEHIATFLQDGKVDQEEMPAYSELTSAPAASSTTAWCCTSYYFENMKRGGAGEPSRALCLSKGGRGELRVLGDVEDRFRQHRQDARGGLGNLLSGPATRGGSPTTGSLCTRSATSLATSPCW